MDRHEVRQTLGSYTPATPRETRFLDRMVTLATTAEDPFGRHGFTPGHFTASAFVLSPSGDELLLIHHGKLDRWLQPGGHAEETDRDLSATARREVQEETGLSELEPWGEGGVFDVDIHRIPAHGDEPAHEHFDVRFLFRSPRRELDTGAEVRGARWVKLGKVSALESDSSVMRAVTKLAGRAGQASAE